MARDLRQRIERALSEHVDDALFEQCSWDLLLPVYPGLTPIPGGYDFGRDADIHGSDETSRLLATTGRDVRRNLTKSLDRLAESGLRARHVVIATTQSLSARRQEGLRKLAAERHVVRVDIFERQAWVSRLYHDAEWRYRLLGIGGEPRAVVDVPRHLELSGGLNIPLIGREDEVARLGEGDADWVVAGVAGSGKTRLVAALPRVGFVLDAPIAAVADDVRAGEFEYLVVDDADRRPGLLSALAEVRRSEALSFRLIGTTWPEHTAALADELIHSRRLELPLLERSQIDEVAEALGVNDYYVRREILEQSEGRPGWAFALGEMALHGDVASITSGRGLIDEVERFLRQAGLATALGLIAHVAALGSLHPDDFGRLAAYLQIPRLSVDEQVSRIMRAGLAESERGRLAIRPEPLRRALVARWFFAEFPRSLDELLSSWPDERDGLIKSIIQAAELGSQGARAKVLSLLHQGRLSVGNLRSAAVVDEEMARAVIEAAAGSPGMTEVYEVAARRYALSEAVKALLDLGMNDERPRHSHPDHPIRIVSEIGTRLYPHSLTSFEARARVLDAAIHWVHGSEALPKWITFSEVIGNVLSPQVEGSWPELGSSNKFTMAAGFESPANLEAIEKDYWPRVAPLLHDMPDEAVSVLADLLDAWIRVARGYPGAFGATPNSSASKVAIRLSRRMKSEFAERARGRPGLTVRFRTIARLLKSPIAVEARESDEFTRLSRDILDRRDWKRAEREHNRSLRSLAGSWAAEAPRSVVSRIVEWQRQARIGHTQIDSSVAFVIRTAIETGASAQEWAEAVIEANLCPAGAPALDAVLRDSPAVPGWLQVGLNGPCRGSIVDSVLSRPPSASTAAVIAALDARDTEVVEWAIKRRKDADETCRRLLAHPDAAVRGSAALGFRLPGLRHGPELPVDWKHDWALAITAIDMGLHGAHRDFEIREMLQSLVVTAPDIAEAWIQSALGTAEYAVGALPHDADEYLHNLPRPNRDRLLRTATDKWNRAQLLRTLLGVDVEWAGNLLREGAITPAEVLNAIAGRVGDSLEVFLPLLLANGVSPQDAASRAHFNRVWRGSESNQYAELRDYFGALAKSEDASVAAVGAAGEALYSKAYGNAMREEKEERIRGR